MEQTKQDAKVRLKFIRQLSKHLGLHVIKLPMHFFSTMRYKLEQAVDNGDWTDEVLKEHWTKLKQQNAALKQAYSFEIESAGNPRVSQKTIHRFFVHKMQKIFIESGLACDVDGWQDEMSILINGSLLGYGIKNLQGVVAIDGTRAVVGMALFGDLPREKLYYNSAVRRKDTSALLLEFFAKTGTKKLDTMLNGDIANRKVAEVKLVCSKKSQHGRPKLHGVGFLVSCAAVHFLLKQTNRKQPRYEHIAVEIAAREVEGESDDERMRAIQTGTQKTLHAMFSRLGFTHQHQHPHHTEVSQEQGGPIEIGADYKGYWMFVGRGDIPPFDEAMSNALRNKFKVFDENTEKLHEFCSAPMRCL